MATHQKHITPLYGYHAALLGLRGRWVPIQPPSEAPSTTRNRNNPTSLKILTYNIWFDVLFKAERCDAVMRIVEEEEPDILCFQEVTPGFEAKLRWNSYFRKNWYMTGLDNMIMHTGSHYGTSIMVNRKTLKRLGVWANAFWVDFPGTQTGRVLLGLEIAENNTGNPTFNIGTIHLDYTPQQRAVEFGICVQSLAESINGAPVTASLFCGDTNATSYPETGLPLAGGYEDAWMTTHPLTMEELGNSGVDLLKRDVTYGAAGIRTNGGSKAVQGKEDPRRLDLVFSKGFKVGGCRRVGDVPIGNEYLKHLDDEKLKDLQIFPSDHVGVVTELEC
ncbi:hypothetical protein FRB95_013577 [Tulasnella sp. JGI-2019a]|nr:hypothetical protein FRB95_013577 [Tulasnella sp. JGI-2019a]